MKHMVDETNVSNKHFLLCPRRPILICTDKDGGEVPLNSTTAVRQITRFGKCLNEMCMFNKRCQMENS